MAMCFARRKYFRDVNNIKKSFIALWAKMSHGGPINELKSNGGGTNALCHCRSITVKSVLIAHVHLLFMYATAH